MNQLTTNQVTSNGRNDFVFEDLYLSSRQNGKGKAFRL